MKESANENENVDVLVDPPFPFLLISPDERQEWGYIAVDQR